MNKKEYFEDNDEFSINFGIRDVIGGIRKFWLPGVILIVVCTVICAVRAQKQYMPVYQVTSSFSVELKNEDNGNTQGAIQQEKYSFGDEKETAYILANSFSSVVSSSTVQNLLKNELGTDYVNGTISAELVERTNVLSVKVSGNQSEDIYRIACAVADHFSEIAWYVAGDDYDFTMIEEPVKQETPVNSVDTGPQAAAGALAGTAVWCLSLFLYVITRKNIRKETDVTGKLGKPFIGELPKVKTAEKKNAGTVFLMKSGEFPGFYRSISRIASHLVRSMDERHERVLLVTGTVEGEGKSMTAANLALVLSGKGRRVLLVDADLHRRDTAFLPADLQDSVPGLTDYYEGELFPEDLPVHSDELNCDVVTGGRNKENFFAPQVLGSEKNAELLRILSKKYDCVLIDTPPCGSYCDALEIARYADQMLFVIGYDSVKPAQVQEALERFTPAGIYLAGCVLNAVPFSGKASGLK